MRSRAILCLAFTTIVLICSVGARATDYELYYLGGQSNMEGYGFVKDLPDEMTQPMDGVMIFHGNSAPDASPVDGRGIWTKLQPGHGTGFQSDGTHNKYADRFGVELSFAAQLRKTRPHAKIAIIKYARGGTSIDEDAAAQFGCWDPDFDGGEGAARGINQYDHFLATLRHAFAVRDIDGDGEADRLIPAGIVWMQGESDAAYTAAIARRYERNLERLMDLVRAALRVDDLPVVIGRISDSGVKQGVKVWRFGEVVRQAQHHHAETDKAAAIVTTTDNYDYSDRYHYDSAGYLDLGRRFAEAVLTLQKPQSAAVESPLSKTSQKQPQKAS